MLGERGELRVIAVDGKLVLPADDREAVSELQQERLEAVDQGRLEVAGGAARPAVRRPSPAMRMARSVGGRGENPVRCTIWHM